MSQLPFNCVMLVLPQRSDSVRLLVRAARQNGDRGFARRFDDKRHAAIELGARRITFCARLHQTRLAVADRLEQ